MLKFGVVLGTLS